MGCAGVYGQMKGPQRAREVQKSQVGHEPWGHLCMSVLAKDPRSWPIAHGLAGTFLPRPPHPPTHTWAARPSASPPEWRALSKAGLKHKSRNWRDGYKQDQC